MAATTLAGAFSQGTGAPPAASAALEGYTYFRTDLNGGTLYQCKSSVWVQITPGVNAVSPLGLTGAVAASRYAGATASGSPATGTFAKGDFIVDQTGAVWVCTVAGTPGTWVSASGSGVTSLTGTGSQVIVSASTGSVTLSTPQAIATSSQPTFATIAAGGITGAVAASRHAGGVASGSPATGTFLLGDFIVDQTGKIWVCTSAGTPGTWTAGGGGTAAVSLLNYAAASDIVSALSIGSSSWTDFVPNQSFTVTDATALITILWQVGMEMVMAGPGEAATRFVIDSAGTPIYVKAGAAVLETGSDYINPAHAGAVQISPLTAAAHTIKVQVYVDGQSGTAYLRASTKPNTEFAQIQIRQG